MKALIKKVNDKGEAHRDKVIRIMAGVSTLAVVTIWIVLSSVFNQDIITSVETTNTGPDVDAFLQEANEQLGELADSASQAPQIFDDAVTQQEPQDEELTNE